ncbi:MAG: transglutaminase family protein [Chloroflexota bacterium]|nr:transglutaminase family protein [Chloroflexota bacterium]
MNAPVRYEIEHVSRYKYERPVRNCVMAVCLRPQDDERQHLMRFDLSTDPPAPHNAEQDGFGNTRHVLNIHREHNSLAIMAHSIVVMLPTETAPSPTATTESVGGGGWDALRAEADAFADWDFVNPTALTEPTAALAEFVRGKGLDALDGDPLSVVQALMGAVHDSFRYVPGSTSVGSPIDHVLETGEGVCQDFAHVMLAVARSWGVPSRYVSGYVEVSDVADNGGGADGEARTGASHAWVECRLPGLGWVGFDPTNRCLADHRHIRIATGRDYQDVAPTRGVLQGGGSMELDVEVRVRVLP